MFKFLRISILVVMVSTFVLATSESEVKNLVNEATKYCKDVGQEKCFKVFTDKNGKFTKGSLYVFAIGYDGITVAHGGNAKLVGKNLIKVKDPAGNMLIQELIAIAKSKGEGWFDYRWSHPISKKVEPKRSFVRTIENDIFIGSGYYK